MSNLKNQEWFRDQYGHVYAWRTTETGKRSEVIVDARHSSATNDEKTMIAASPELFAALQAMFDKYGSKDPAMDDEVTAQTRAALTKATVG